MRWLRAFRALLRLGRNYKDTAAVMDIVQTLEGRSFRASFLRFSRGGGKSLIERRVELAERFTDPDWLGRFEAGTLGAAYRDFVQSRRVSARELGAYLAKGPSGAVVQNKRSPVSYYARRVCDLHDVAHVLTGYDIDPQGEGCLMAFTFAQIGNPGYLLIALGSAWRFKTLAVWEAYRRGRKSGWLFGMDAETLFAKPLADVRQSLGLLKPEHYRAPTCLFA